MAEVYGRLTGRAGVCSATLGPGAINLLLGVADATTNSTPLLAVSAQVGMGRSYKRHASELGVRPVGSEVRRRRRGVVFCAGSAA
jgi:thiamine pyrophosphate-dependent acetolactate synthase large subunit-like protein